MKAIIKAERKTLHDFVVTEPTTPGVWGQAYSTAMYKAQLCERLAKKAMSGATLSQRDRWQIAELLTGRTHTEPRKPGKEADHEDDHRLFMRFCTIAAEVELEGKIKPKKIGSEAYKILVQEEASKKHTPDDSTIRKAVKRGIYESIRRENKN